jgi:hypothetical protein
MDASTADAVAGTGISCVMVAALSVAIAADWRARRRAAAAARCPHRYRDGITVHQPAVCEQHPHGGHIHWGTDPTGYWLCWDDTDPGAYTEEPK